MTGRTWHTKITGAGLAQACTNPCFMVIADCADNPALAMMGLDAAGLEGINTLATMCAGASDGAGGGKPQQSSFSNANLPESFVDSPVSCT